MHENIEPIISMPIVPSVHNVIVIDKAHQVECLLGFPLTQKERMLIHKLDNALYNYTKIYSGVS